eukprot:5268626-Karenia_brevis.AAC.1
MERRVRSVGRLRTSITTTNLRSMTMLRKRLRKRGRPRVKEKATRSNGGINRHNSGTINGVTKTIRISRVIRIINRVINGLVNGRTNRLGKAKVRRKAEERVEKEMPRINSRSNAHRDKRNADLDRGVGTPKEQVNAIIGIRKRNGKSS